MLKVIRSIRRETFHVFVPLGSDELERDEAEREDAAEKAREAERDGERDRE